MQQAGEVVLGGRRGLARGGWRSGGGRGLKRQSRRRNGGRRLARNILRHLRLGISERRCQLRLGEPGHQRQGRGLSGGRLGRRQLAIQAEQQQRIEFALRQRLIARLFARQGIAALGNRRLLGVSACRRLAGGLLLVGLLARRCRGIVLALDRLGLALARIHLGEAGTLAIARLGRRRRLRGGGLGTHFESRGLEQQIRGNGHGTFRSV